MRLFCFLLLLFITINSFSQGDEFITIIKNPATSVKDQEETGSCWSYATCSFFESELLRLNKGEYNLSEAVLVYYAYIDKAHNYFLRQGKTSFTTGGLAHDALRIIKDKGIVPNETYKGVYLKDSVNDYFEMQDVLEGFLNALMKNKNPSEDWQKHYRALLESYLGNIPNQFEIRGKTYTPLSFSKSLGLNTTDYVSMTSFTHHPFNTKFVLEVPDNYSNGSFYNIPINELIQIIDTALLKGFTIVWDGDISEPTFSTKKKGLAMLPQKDKDGKTTFEINASETYVDQQTRQIAFERLQTTDDHLMHIIGLAKNKEGKKFYIIKNSWGKVGPYNGYTYMSEVYLRMKTVSIMLNKNGLLKEIKNRIE